MNETNLKASANNNQTQIEKWKSDIENLPATILIEKDSDIPIWIQTKAGIKKDIKEINSDYKPKKDKARQVLNIFIDEEKELVIPRTKAVEFIDRNVSNYEMKREQEREAERTAKLKLVEEEEKRLRRELKEEARELKDSGNVEQAEILKEQAKNIILDPVTVEDDNKIVNTGDRNLSKKFDFEVFITDDREALQSILDNKAPLGAVTINPKAVKRFFKDMKTDLNNLPAGFRIEKKIKY